MGTTGTLFPKQSRALWRVPSPLGMPGKDSQPNDIILRGATSRRLQVQACAHHGAVVGQFAAAVHRLGTQCGRTGTVFLPLRLLPRKLAETCNLGYVAGIYAEMLPRALVWAAATSQCHDSEEYSCSSKTKPLLPPNAEPDQRGRFPALLYSCAPAYHYSVNLGRLSGRCKKSVKLSFSLGFHISLVLLSQLTPRSETVVMEVGTLGKAPSPQ